MYNVYITKVKNIRPAENADRLNLCEVFSNTTVVDKSVNETDLYIYFPTDGQISVEFGEANNLFRKKDAEGNQVGGFIDPDKRNITAIKLRGNKSDGLVLPLSALASFGDISTLKEGDIVSVFNGHQIAQKYIPKRAGRAGSSNGMAGNRTRKKKVPTAPLFAEHCDTEQLQYNLSAFRPGDFIEITEKCHGTSTRTGYLPILKRYKRSLLDRLLKKEGKPVYEYGYVSGTRRTILENYEGGYYGSNEFREQHSKFFEGKLHKQEVVYGEIVGFVNDTTPIMPSCQNKKLNDKNFIKQYGEVTTFSYGCEPTGKKKIYGYDSKGAFSNEVEAPQSDLYIYRITSTNEDGDIIEYSPEQIKFRCEQMGAKKVPLLWEGFIPKDIENAGDWVLKLAEELAEGPSTIDHRHLREGVVVRIVNRPKLESYKYKSFNFRVLEGIIKTEAVEADVEEQEDLL